MRVAAILLAAGEGQRMGEPKALLRIEKHSFLLHCLGFLSRPAIGAVVVVLGHEAERVRDILLDVDPRTVPPTIIPIVNLRYRDGMLGSIICGLEAAASCGAEAVLVHPVDHPLVQPATVDVVLSALASGARIAVASHGGRRGHPAGFAKSVWPYLRSAPPDRGARAVLSDHPDWIVQVPGDPGCLIGIDTPYDYEQWIGSRSC